MSKTSTKRNNQKRQYEVAVENNIDTTKESYWIDIQKWKRRTKLRLAQEFGYICEACGVREINVFQLQLDHVVPIRAGGTSEYRNLQLICQKCHLIKNVEEEKMYGAN